MKLDEELGGGGRTSPLFGGGGDALLGGCPTLLNQVHVLSDGQTAPSQCPSYAPVPPPCAPGV